MYHRSKPNMRLELITPDGISYDLHNPPNRVVWSMSGWGLSPREISTTKGPFQHGVSVMSQTLEPREIALTLRHNGCSFSAHKEHRSLYIDYFRENRSLLFSPEPSQLIQHYVERGVYKSRAVDVYLTDGFAFSPPNTGAWDNYAIQEELRFFAPNPLVYDPTLQTHTASSFVEQLVLPVTFPFVLGAYQASGTITYTGTWETFPTIVVEGPAKNFSIINTSTDKRINYAGEIGSGSTLTFNLDYDYKTAEDDCGNSVLHNVTGDIGLFSLQCDPILSGGTNVIKVVTEGYDPSTTEFNITYYIRYRGV